MIKGMMKDRPSHDILLNYSAMNNFRNGQPCVPSYERIPDGASRYTSVEDANKLLMDDSCLSSFIER